MLCYIHIPKAAGTTLNYILRHSLGRSFLEVEPWIDIRRVFSPADLKLLRERMPWVEHISSHYVRAYSMLETVQEDIKYFTIIREPIARYISDFYHLKDINARVANFYEFLNNKAWRNKQTKYIAGCEDVEKAKQILMDKFVFVGLLECMDESLVMLKKTLPEIPLDIRYGTPKNVSKRKQEQQNVRDHWEQYAEWAHENNRADMELYRFVTEELYPSQKERYGLSLENDVASFKVENVSVSPKPLWGSRASRLYYKLLLTYFRKHGKKFIKIDNGWLSKEYDFFGEYVF
jgi:hypothetical protein